ncbi:MAG: hypothetical protein LBJ37_16185 [Paucimonas sp.]|jgi:Cu/Ag efflux protein CusF|nr:hypothetical protein [Paucimonas sp.]
MKPFRSVPRAIAFASLLSIASASQAATLPLGGEALESHITTKVLSVDAASYQVTLEGQNGKPVTVQLSEHARNLHNLKVGDQVDLYVTRAVAYSLDKDVGGVPKVSQEVGTIRQAGDNPNPGGQAFRQVKVISTINKIDLKNHEVTLLPPEGPVKVVKVEDPGLQARMKNLKVGQKVEAVYTEVLTIETSR